MRPILPQLKQFPSVHTINQNYYINYISHFIRQMPGIAALKTPDSVYAAANQLCAQMAGYKRLDNYIGTDDYEWKCDAVEYADEIRRQDQLVLQTGKTWNSFNIMNFSEGCTYYFSNKSVFSDPSGKIIGVLFLGTILSDMAIINTLASLMQIDPLKSKRKNQCSVYTINQEHENELGLTQREEECLFYILRGKTAKEIGKILNISHRTVEVYILNIKDKFGCQSCKHISAKAIESGYFYHIPASLLADTGKINVLSDLER